MNYKYPKIIFSLYNLVFFSHFLTSILNIIFPRITNFPDSSGSGSLSNLFIINMLVYLIISGLVGSAISFDQNKNITYQIIMAITGFISAFIPVLFSYILGFGLISSFISGMTSGQIPFVWCDLIAVNILIVGHFYIFQYFINGMNEKQLK